MLTLQAQLNQVSKEPLYTEDDDVVPEERVCGDCEVHKEGLNLCSVCNLVFCEDCWKRCLPHRRSVPGGIPHEKTDVDLARKIQACIAPEWEESTLAILHAKDARTIWFDCDSDARFFDNDRFDELISDYPTIERPRLCPSIVSFMGQTGEVDHIVASNKLELIICRFRKEQSHQLTHICK